MKREFTTTRPILNWWRFSVTDATVSWLLEGDPSIAWQVQKGLLNLPKRIWQKKRDEVAEKGWGARLLSKRASDGTWGGGLYTPKWKSTFYTLQLLSKLGLTLKSKAVADSFHLLLGKGLCKDGGISFWGGKIQDICVTAMALTMAKTFGVTKAPYFKPMTSWLLDRQLPDGGWNCLSRTRKVSHSSFHTTLSVLEALALVPKTNKVKQAIQSAHDFLFAHHLYKSHRTGKISDPAFTKFFFPTWWHYDVLRALEYFASQGIRHAALADGLSLLKKARCKDGRWLLAGKHSGQVWFQMEKVQQPSPWITLRALKVLKQLNTPS